MLLTAVPLLFSTLSLIRTVNAEDDDMGPATFLWPDPRDFSKAYDTIGPCGDPSVSVSRSRTEFPLTGGAVSLVLQDESFNVNLAISYSSEPTNNSNFTTLVSSSSFPELYPGHKCYSVPDPPSNVIAGSNATLQLTYLSTASSTSTSNTTFYVCADIYYIALSAFTADVPCFNVSTEDYNLTSSAVGETTASATSTRTSATSAAISTSDSRNSGNNNNKLSGGAIAGVVVGSVIGVAAACGLVYFVWRHRQQKARRDKIVALRMNEWTNPKKVGCAEPGE